MTLRHSCTVLQGLIYWQMGLEKVVGIVYRYICVEYGFGIPEGMENLKAKNLLDFSVHTDKLVKVNQSDIQESLGENNSYKSSKPQGQQLQEEGTRQAEKKIPRDERR